MDELLNSTEKEKKKVEKKEPIYYLKMTTADILKIYPLEKNIKYKSKRELCEILEAQKSAKIIWR